MGQQQLLLIMLGVIVVGIAVAVGLMLFSDSAASTNRDALTSDLVYLASRAQQYYRRPASMNGGDGSFASLTFDKLYSSVSNSNGRYFINGAPSATQVTIRGVGREKINATDTVTVDMRVTADSATVTVVH
jgi:Tfp pilus assembly protein PilE